MIRSLAIETSSRIGSVALAQDGKLLAEETFPHGLQHAARIVPAIDALCRGAGWTSGDIAHIYVSAGPGSFTGLRIGITLAKTLAFATGAKLVAVPTVRVLAENAPRDAQNLIIVIDAKRDQIFTASFEKSGLFWKPLQPAHLGTLTAMLATTPRPVCLLGEGIPYHRKFVPENDPLLSIADESLWRPRAEIVAKLGWELAQQGCFTAPMELIPIYIRRPEAEEKLEASSAAVKSPNAK
ncbi:MAG: tRNA (adenosine(37)-N6)-threonylcarbamoyltransferase complex dimerization subunit type 1 TsaB [Planctomycetota bacterium]|nr:tRNA (adenosine(37)-N6)-threonylcarbamoyltransferase complex dimerization subunit type 1 TsaB [Planctomycetota bacterium]